MNGSEGSAGWRDAATDPTSTEAIRVRAEQMASVWRPGVTDRELWLEAFVRGRSILDVGCVDHSAERGVRPSSLHTRLAAAASDCVGVDYLASEVATMVDAGFDVRCADVTEEPPGDLVAEGPFERIVAGEIIEHLGNPQALFRFARPLLAGDGRLAVTTPNPYALGRVRSGWVHQQWENADHTVYLFPGGIAEMAHREGLRLVEVVFVQDLAWSLALRRSIRRWGAAVAARARGRRSAVPTGVLDLDHGWRYLPVSTLLVQRRSWDRMGETVIYVLAADR